ncbi:hypothetical protein NE237_016158 [Protea cynaroides]|uniref:ATP synthase CF0 subunit IV n=1 Tax=Protea cynaroides TaxID=273540 RepID=A0A9Q0KFB3_9MAGN|nr:hypothetical protein NE237_016158 [Protea cynaroides]
MNVLPCSINTLKGFYDISGVEVGQHFYWQIGSFQVHAQVLITSWVVIAILLGSTAVAVRNPQTIPPDSQNFFEYVLEFIRDLRKTQIGEEYGPWVPFFFFFLGVFFFLKKKFYFFLVVVLVSLVPSVVPIPVMFLGLFTSGIQALIFATLAAAYIGESMEGHH